MELGPRNAWQKGKKKTQVAEQPLVNKGKDIRSSGGLNFPETLKWKRNFYIGLKVRNVILLF